MSDKDKREAAMHVAWLRKMSEENGKGVVNNVDARALARAAESLAAAQKRILLFELLEAAVRADKIGCLAVVHMTDPKTGWKHEQFMGTLMALGRLDEAAKANKLRGCVNPNQCGTCDFMAIANGEDWCYMFKDEPTGPCMSYKRE